MAIELEKIKSWDGQSGTGADNRGVIDRNFDKVKTELEGNKAEIVQLAGDVNVLNYNVSVITQPTRNLYSAEYENINYQVDINGIVGLISPSWMGTLMPISPSTEYSIQNGSNLYGHGLVGDLAYLDSSKVKISSVDMNTLPVAGLKGRKFTTPANCAYLAFNSKVGIYDFSNSLQVELGGIATSYTLHMNIKSSRIDTLEADVARLNLLPPELSLEDPSITIGSHPVGSQQLTPDVTFVRAEPVATRSVLKSAKLSVFTSNIECKIVILGSDKIVKSIIDFEFTGLETTIPGNIIVEAGDFIGTYSPIRVFGLSSGGTIYTWYKAGSPTVGAEFTDMYATPIYMDPLYVVAPIESVKTVVSSNTNRITALEGSTTSSAVTVEDATVAMYMGSSLTDSYYQPKSTSWIERLNDITDVCIVNNGTSGRNLKTNMTAVVSNDTIRHDSGNTPKGLKPNFIIWNNSANGTPAGITGKQQLMNAKEITESLGAKMVLGSEEDFNNIAKALEDTYKSFANEWGLIYSPMIQVWRKCYPSGNPYLGFMGSNHSGYRSMAPYSMHRDMLDSLPIYKNVKMFKVRPTYKAGSPAITDLVFDNNKQRIKFFTAISSGADDSIGTGALDNLDDHAYDVSGGSNDGISISEISLMRRNSIVTFNKYALIEFIVDKIKITKADFEVTSVVNPTTVYLAVTKNTSTTFNDSPRTEFISVPFTYSGGKILCSVTRTDYDIQLYDKVRIIIYYSGGSFSLGSPKLSNYDGVEKPKPVQGKYDYRQFGIELNPLTSFPSSGHGWTLGGTSTVKAFPIELANYTSYNAVKSHLQLQDDTATATKTIALNDVCTKVAIRVIAQNFYKIATTRFVGTGIESSEYLATTPQVIPYDYDYGHLRLIINDNIVKDFMVLQGWHELYVEIDLNPTDTQIKLALSRNSLVDASFGNANCPILIHDISVQKLK